MENKNIMFQRQFTDTVDSNISDAVLGDVCSLHVEVLQHSRMAVVVHKENFIWLLIGQKLLPLTWSVVD